MGTYSLKHLSDAILRRGLVASVANESAASAMTLAHIAEFDARRLYVPEGYPSMYAFCVEELGLTEDSALKRIQAMRAAREFPDLFTALAEGRLHLTAIRLLAPHLTPDSAGELIQAATHRSKSEIERLLAQRLARQSRSTAAGVATSNSEHAPGHVGATSLSGVKAEQHAPGHVEAPDLELTPDATEDAQPKCFRVLLTLDEGTHDELRYAQALLSHAVPSGDVAQVFKRALKALIGQLEKRKCGASTKSKVEQRKSCDQRHIPAQVRRAVWERDQGRCTFVSESGHRCGSPKFLEFDHVEPVARGGQATVGAEQAFGAGFMHEKRERARGAAEARPRPLDDTCIRPTADVTKSHDQRPAREHTLDVIAGLRSLGVGVAEARRAAEFSERPPDATLEDCMRAALQFIAPKVKRIGFSAATST